MTFPPHYQNIPQQNISRPYLSKKAGWCTIMGPLYISETGQKCITVPYFSSPNLKFPEMTGNYITDLHSTTKLYRVVV